MVEGMAEVIWALMALVVCSAHEGESVGESEEGVAGGGVDAGGGGDGRCLEGVERVETIIGG
jgi:hypothetical protein